MAHLKINNLSVGRIVKEVIETFFEQSLFQRRGNF